MVVALFPIAGHSPGKDHKHSVKAPRSPSKGTPSSDTGQHQNPPTPPPVMYTSSPGPNGSSTSSSSNNGGMGSSSPMPNGQVSSPQVQQRRDSTQSDDGNIQLLFSSNVDGSARAPSTGNDVRDRCRDLIAKALKKGFSDGKDSSSVGFMLCLLTSSSFFLVIYSQH